MMTSVPTATMLTSPVLAFTLATVGSELDQVKVLGPLAAVTGLVKATSSNLLLMVGVVKLAGSD